MDKENDVTFLITTRNHSMMMMTTSEKMIVVFLEHAHLSVEFQKQKHPSLVSYKESGSHVGGSLLSKGISVRE